MLVAVIPERCSPENPGSGRVSRRFTRRVFSRLICKPSHPSSLPSIQSPQLRADVASQHDKVVGIANQLCLGPLPRSIPPLKQVVEPVQVDVGQQRTEHASLRSAPVVASHRRRLAALRRFHHWRFEPLSNQPQNRAVHDAHPHTSDELVLRNAIEVAGQVRVIHRRLALRQVPADDSQRIVRRPPGRNPCEQSSKSASKIGSRISNTAACTTRSRTVGMPNGRSFSIGLGDIDPPHRLGAIGPLLQAPLDVLQKGRFAFRRRRDLFDAHSIYARCAVVAPHRRPGGLQHVPPTHQPVETVEAIPLLLFGFLAQLLSQLLKARRQNRFPKGKSLLPLVLS